MLLRLIGLSAHKQEDGSSFVSIKLYTHKEDYIMVKRYHTARILLVCFVFGCLTIGISPRVMSVGNGLDGDFVSVAMAEGDGGDSHDGDSHDGDGHDGDGHDGDSHDGDSHDGDGHDGDGQDGGGEAGDPAPSYEAKPTVKQY